MYERFMGSFTPQTKIFHFNYIPWKLLQTKQIWRLHIGRAHKSCEGNNLHDFFFAIWEPIKCLSYPQKKIFNLQARDSRSLRFLGSTFVTEKTTPVEGQVGESSMDKLSSRHQSSIYSSFMGSIFLRSIIFGLHRLDRPWFSILTGSSWNIYHDGNDESVNSNG